tara:strand:+ start:710 stop:970 length:261 start_codon:yes stop_codon:yes gene_type:complete
MVKKLKWSRGSGNKKYKVVITDTKTKKKKTVQFGDKRYQQFKDKTPLKLYSSKNHLDNKRRTSYIKRHNYKKPKHSAGWFARNYLW